MLHQFSVYFWLIPNAGKNQHHFSRKYHLSVFFEARDKNKLELGADMNLFAILFLAQDCRLVCKFFNQLRVKSRDKFEQQNTDN